MKVKVESEKVGLKLQKTKIFRRSSETKIFRNEDLQKRRSSENEDHGIQSHHFMGNRWGNSGNSGRLYFWGLQKSLQMVIAAMNLKDTYSLEEKL